MWIYTNKKNNKYDTWFNWEINNNIDITQFKEVISGVENFESDHLSQIMKDKISTINPNTILDYGSGLGRNYNLLKTYTDNIDYLDLNHYQVNYIDYINNLGYKNLNFIEMIPECLVGKKYDMIYASVVLQHIVDDEVYEKIVKILTKSCKHLFLVQNMSPIKDVLFKHFELEYEEISDVYFGVDHRYCIFKSKDI